VDESNILSGLRTQVTITNHQSPITNHQSPITNQQSPINNHQSTIINQQSTINNHQSTMNIFEDFSKFLEEKLEEFLQQNPQLELQAILDRVTEQENETVKSIANLKLKQKKLEDELLSVAKDIEIWHTRINKAQAAGRLDLAQAAHERKASLLRQGNLLWGQMEEVKRRIMEAQELLPQIQQKRKEVTAKIQEMKANQTYTKNQSANKWDNIGWEKGVNYSNYNRFLDPLEEEFSRWETEEELQQMKRNLNL
jgi:uncharacterized protein (TIGR04376 family)